MTRKRNTIAGNGLLRFAAVALTLGVVTVAPGQNFQIGCCCAGSIAPREGANRKHHSKVGLPATLRAVGHGN